MPVIAAGHGVVFGPNVPVFLFFGDFYNLFIDGVPLVERVAQPFDVVLVGVKSEARFVVG